MLPVMSFSTHINPYSMTLLIVRPISLPVLPHLPKNLSAPGLLSSGWVEDRKIPESSGSGPGLPPLPSSRNANCVLGMEIAPGGSGPLQ
jgi:hypothetical protein